jgi:hypothetical protein
MISTTCILRFSAGNRRWQPKEQETTEPKRDRLFHVKQCRKRGLAHLCAASTFPATPGKLIA